MAGILPSNVKGRGSSAERALRMLFDGVKVIIGLAIVIVAGALLYRHVILPFVDTTKNTKGTSLTDPPCGIKP